MICEVEKKDLEECILNNLCVLAEYRHKSVGKELLEHAVSEARKLGCSIMNVGIVEHFL